MGATLPRLANRCSAPPIALCHSRTNHRPASDAPFVCSHLASPTGGHAPFMSSPHPLSSMISRDAFMAVIAAGGGTGMSPPRTPEERGTVGCSGALATLLLADPLYPPPMVAPNDSSEGGLALYCLGSPLQSKQSSGKSLAVTPLKKNRGPVVFPRPVVLAQRISRPDDFHLRNRASKASWLMTIRIVGSLFSPMTNTFQHTEGSTVPRILIWIFDIQGLILAHPHSQCLLIHVSASDTRQPLPVVLLTCQRRVRMLKLVAKNSSSHREDITL